MKKQTLFLLLAFSISGTAAEISITMDDFDVTESTLIIPGQRNYKILQVLAERKTRAALFVTARFVQSAPGKLMLKRWNQLGHMIANHTYSHPYFGDNITADEFTTDIAKAHKALSPYSGFEKLFRYPYLNEGTKEEKRDQVRAWLKKNGYRNGNVTIDTSDWYIDKRMRQKLAEDPKFDLTRYRDFYLEHMWERAQYYNELAKKVVGREVKHTLLIHFNLLNALYLKDLLNMFETRGWKWIHAYQAFRDPIFESVPNTMPSGQSLIWALAKETGKFDGDLRYPGEDGRYEEAKMDRLGL